MASEMTRAQLESEIASMQDVIERLTRERDEWKAKANESATVRRLETMLLDSMSETEQAERERDEARAYAETLRVNKEAAWVEVRVLRALVAKLERGIEAYRQIAQIETSEDGTKWVAVAWGGNAEIHAAWTWEREQREEDKP